MAADVVFPPQTAVSSVPFNRSDLTDSEPPKPFSGATDAVHPVGYQRTRGGDLGPSLRKKGNGLPTDLAPFSCIRCREIPSGSIITDLAHASKREVDLFACADQGF